MNSRAKAKKIANKETSRWMISHGVGFVCGAGASGTTAGAIVSVLPPFGKFMGALTFIGAVSIGTCVGLAVEKKVTDGVYDTLKTIDEIRAMVGEHVDEDEVEEED